jgi:hypothetical protein
MNSAHEKVDYGHRQPHLSRRDVLESGDEPRRRTGRRDAAAEFVIEGEAQSRGAGRAGRERCEQREGRAQDEMTDHIPSFASAGRRQPRGSAR